jgi:hypothetical protein
MMPGFTNDYTFEALYRLRPSLWVSDALIGAFCERVCNDASQVRNLGVLERKPTTGRLRRQPVSDDMKARISKAALEETTDALIIPVNFSNAHWTLVMVLLAAKEILSTIRWEGLILSMCSVGSRKISAICSTT